MIKHKTIVHINSICSRCKTPWIDLYHTVISNKNNKRLNLEETNLDFVNRCNPCLTDDELIIKNIIE